MEKGLKTELKKLEAFGAVEFAVLKDLFQGWDHVDFLLVEAAIQAASTRQQLRERLDHAQWQEDEQWAMAWEVHFGVAWKSAGYANVRETVALLRRLQRITNESEFRTLAEALRVQMPSDQETPGRRYITGAQNQYELPRSVRNGLDNYERLFEIRNVARFDQEALSSASAIKERFPNAGNVVDGLLGEMRRGFSLADDTIRIRPTIILGTPGVGKTTMVRAMLEGLGVVPEIVSVAGHNDSQIFGVSAGWSSDMPSVMTTAILKQGVLNPVLVVDEIDKVRPSHNGDIYAELLLLTEPTDAKTYRDKFLSTTTDCSAISWVFTANSLERIPEALRSRCVIYKMDAPNQSQLPAILRSMHAAYAVERGVDPRMIPLTLEDREVVIDDFTQHTSLRRSKELIRILVDFRQGELGRA
ncbi:Lon protease [Roseovarius albus]|uniref:Lon protease n=1 Tax=Roseovarius albus TaxID=1247867 RepID=A0A1X7A9D0_9RHOB|nr:AAA family ATPase [Roseovarius albus]SLN72119.1 Lon protease [Roseovarius albus]